jgi:DNA-binding NarL/FixJ family response regulator
MATDAGAPIQVLLIDDHTVVRTALRMLIESHPGFVVVGEAADRRGALALLAQVQPDVILLDIALSQISGVDLIPELRARAPRARVLLLTGIQDIEEHRRAVRLGARGVVLKDQAPAVLVKAIERVHAGEVWLDGMMVADLVSEIAAGSEPPAEPQPIPLTERERQVIALVCEGLPNRAIAERLMISDTTVRHHLTSVFNKLGVNSRLELVIYAYRHGLARPPC